MQPEHTVNTKLQSALILLLAFNQPGIGNVLDQSELPLHGGTLRFGEEGLNPPGKDRLPAPSLKRDDDTETEPGFDQEKAGEIREAFESEGKQKDAASEADLAALKRKGAVAVALVMAGISPMTGAPAAATAAAVDLAESAKDAKESATREQETNESRSKQVEAVLAMPEAEYTKYLDSLDAEKDGELIERLKTLREVKFSEESGLSAASVTGDKLAELIEGAARGDRGFIESYGKLTSRRTALEKKASGETELTDAESRELEAIKLLQSNMQHQLHVAMEKGAFEGIDPSNGDQFTTYNELTKLASGWPRGAYSPEPLKADPDIVELRRGSRVKTLFGYRESEDDSPQKVQLVKAVTGEDGITMIKEGDKTYAHSYTPTQAKESGRKIIQVPNVRVEAPGMAPKHFPAVNIGGETYIVSGSGKNQKYVHLDFVDYFGDSVHSTANPSTLSRASFGAPPTGERKYSDDYLTETAIGYEANSTKAVDAAVDYAARVAAMTPEERTTELEKHGINPLRVGVEPTSKGPILTLPGTGNGPLTLVPGAEGVRQVCTNCSLDENNQNPFASVITKKPDSGDWALFDSSHRSVRLFEVLERPTSVPAPAPLVNVSTSEATSRLLSHIRANVGTPQSTGCVGCGGAQRWQPRVKQTPVVMQPPPTCRNCR